MIPMNARKLTQIGLAALLVGGLGACSKAGHGHSARYGGADHMAHSGQYGSQHAGGWETQGWDAGGVWQTADGSAAYGSAHGAGYGSAYPQPGTQYAPQAAYGSIAPTGGTVIIPRNDAPRGSYNSGGQGYNGVPMPAPAPIPGVPPVRSRYGDPNAANGGACCVIPQIVYVDRVQTVEVEKIVEKPVERIVEVEKIVEKIVEVEKPVYIEVEKPGYIPVPTPPRPKSRK